MTTETDPAEQRGKIIKNLVKRLTAGSPLYTEDDFHEKLRELPFTWDEFERMQAEAVAIYDQEEQAEKDRQLAELREHMDATIDDMIQELVDNDPSNIVREHWLDAMESNLRAILSEKALAKVNAELARHKQGPLTYRDLAWIGVIHRNSVLTNGLEEEKYRHTSPVSRFHDQATRTGYRDKAFDSRQIRYALTLLVKATFTSCTAAEVYKGKNHPDNRAARWELSEDRIWTDIFDVTPFPHLSIKDEESSSKN